MASQRLPRRSPAALPRMGLWLLLACVAGLLVCLRAQFSLCLVQGESMLPVLRSGDLLLVDKLAYRAPSPERGDIVVARNRHDLIVKRIVGLPGEEVELRQGELYVNRRLLAEDYPVEPGWLNLRRGRLFEDKYALLGDNRSVATSLSVHAIVSKDEIVGKVVYSIRLWPAWQSQGKHPRGPATTLVSRTGEQSM